MIVWVVEVIMIQCPVRERERGSVFIHLYHHENTGLIISEESMNWPLREGGNWWRWKRKMKVIP